MFELKFKTSEMLCGCAPKNEHCMFLLFRKNAVIGHKKMSVVFIFLRRNKGEELRLEYKN